MLRVLLPCRLTQQPRHQRVAQEEPRHLAAQFGEICLTRIRLKQYPERFAVVVVVGAEIIEPTGLDGRGVQILDGPDIGTWCHALNSPQLTSRVCPVIPLDRALAMNRLAD